MVVEVFSTKDKDNYLKLYYCVNKACNGLLTRTELLRAYRENGFVKVNEIELDKILSFVDQDGNGFVTFSEFLAACVSAEDILTPSKLSAAFHGLDQDRSNTLDLNELEQVLAKYAKIPDDMWERVLRDVDDDGSGKLNLDEFIIMMRNIFS